jgi:hypothetical protein
MVDDDQKGPSLAPIQKVKMPPISIDSFTSSARFLSHFDLVSDI